MWFSTVPMCSQCVVFTRHCSAQIFCCKKRLKRNNKFIFRFGLSLYCDLTHFNIFAFHKRSLTAEKSDMCLIFFLFLLDESLWELFEGSVHAKLSQPTNLVQPWNTRACPHNEFEISKTKTVKSKQGYLPLESQWCVNALWLSWKMGLKVVNFDKLFLHQFSTKIYQTLRDDV